MDDKVNLAKKLATFSDHWATRTVAKLNDLAVMVAKVEGEFVSHAHDDTDDFFLVLAGEIEIQLGDRVVTLGPGDAATAAPRREIRGPSSIAVEAHPPRAAALKAPPPGWFAG